MRGREREECRREGRRTNKNWKREELWNGGREGRGIRIRDKGEEWQRGKNKRRKKNRESKEECYANDLEKTREKLGDWRKKTTQIWSGGRKIIHAEEMRDKIKKGIITKGERLKKRTYIKEVKYENAIPFSTFSFSFSIFFGRGLGSDKRKAAAIREQHQQPRQGGTGYTFSGFCR